jgi:hypothetical protein
MTCVQIPSWSALEAGGVSQGMRRVKRRVYDVPSNWKVRSGDYDN